MFCNIKNNFIFFLMIFFIVVVSGSLAFRVIYNPDKNEVTTKTVEDLNEEEIVSEIVKEENNEEENNEEENNEEGSEEASVIGGKIENNIAEKKEDVVEDVEIIENKKEITTIPVIEKEDEVIGEEKLLILKDVGEPYLGRFGLGPLDYNKIKDAGFNVIQSNFDICANPSDVLMFLSGASDAGLKVIMPAGSGEAEWGYSCDDENIDDSQKPVWQKDLVQAWVKKWSYHKAIYAWDISNEDGQNFPNAQKYDEDWTDRGYAVTLEQLQNAYSDVKEADSTRPIMVRMNGWYFYDYDSDFFRKGNAFGPEVADIVMVNAYSNVQDYFSDLVGVVSSRARDAVQKVNSNAKIIVALGAWEEPPMWKLPTVEEFTNDVNQINKTDGILGTAIFKYGAEEGEWLMPKDAPVLWEKINEIL